jgi:hypothetical protein
MQLTADAVNDTLRDGELKAFRRLVEKLMDDGADPIAVAAAAMKTAHTALGYASDTDVDLPNVEIKTPSQRRSAREDRSPRGERPPRGNFSAREDRPARKDHKPSHQKGKTEAARPSRPSAKPASKTASSAARAKGKGSLTTADPAHFSSAARAKGKSKKKAKEGSGSKFYSKFDKKSSRKKTRRPR